MRLFAAGVSDWRLRAVIYEVMNGLREAWVSKEADSIADRVAIYRAKLREIKSRRREENNG